LRTQQSWLGERDRQPPALSLLVMDERSDKEIDAERRRRGYRLPDVLVADRAASGLVLAALVAVVCALGIIRGCQLVPD
jgi:hypothetical protein